MYSDKYEIYHYYDNYLNSVSLHHHDYYEIYYFLSGNVNYVIGGRNYQLLPGDLLLISPMELHQPRIAMERLPYERIVLWIDRHYMEYISAGKSRVMELFDVDSPTHQNLLRLNREQQATVHSYLEKLLAEDKADNTDSGTFAACQLLCLLIETLRIAESTTAPVADATRGKTERLIAAVVEHIDTHYDQEISLDSLAEQFFFSKYHLSHEFNRVLGTSIYKYITQKRLLMACQLLLHGSPPTAVYQDCGFREYTSFYRAFRAEYQLSPKEYAAQAQTSARTEQLFPD